MNRYSPNPSRPTAAAIAVFEAIKNLRADKQTGRRLVDAREIAAQMKLTTTEVTSTIESLVEAGVVECDKGPFSKIPCSYVTLVESKSAGSRLPIPERYM